MTVFMTEHTLAGMTPGSLAAFQRGFHEASRRLSAAGRPIRFLRGVYVPSQARWIRLFAAADKEAVHKVMEIAQVPRPRTLEEVLDLVATTGD
jgi:hypothetical protein